MHDREDGCLTMIVGAALLAVVVGSICYHNGHSQGVKDHAAGRYVVVPMPDGTERVCEVKEPK